MAITLMTNLVYNQDSFVTANKVRYSGPVQTYTIKDYIDLGRVAPKPSNQGPGVARSSVKTVRTLVLEDGITKRDVIIETNFAIPVGAKLTDVQDLREMHGEFVSSPECDSLVTKHDLTH